MNHDAPDLAAFLAPGVAARDIPALQALLRARTLLDAFTALFRGSDEEVLLRLLVLREIGHETEAPRWSPEALRARFTYLDPVKLETVLKRLRDNGLIAFGEDSLYRVSDIGRNAVAALAMLLHFNEEEDAELGFLTAQLAGLSAVDRVSAEPLEHLLSKLNDLAWHFEEAIASGSEFNILAARRKLSANERWLARGTELLRELLADPDAPFEIARIAQRIGLAQSRLARVDAGFQRALNKIDAQRVTLGASGISSSDVSAWLRACPLDQLVGLAADALRPVPDLPLLAGGHELADRAEAVLEGQTHRDGADLALPPPGGAEISHRAPEEDLGLLTHFSQRLARIRQPLPLFEAIAGDGFAPAAYRLSLLAMLADADAGTPGEVPAAGPVGEFMRLPLTVCFGDELIGVADPDIARVSSGHVAPRSASEN